MKKKINILPKYLSNKIASGEVINRPSCVVKELLENSIDAKSKNIKLSINNSGKDSILLIDDGEGMNHYDAKKCFKKYATSKIKCLNDIFNIKTKGFRGEALYSISLYSQIKLKTKKKKSDLGTFLFLEKGKIKKKKIINTITGTLIEVKNLFYNFPLKRNFLKSNTIEFNYIKNEFNKIALAHKNICLSLFHNNKLILNLKKSSLKKRIINIFGEKIKKELIHFSGKNNYIKLYGFILKSNFFKKKQKKRFLFINKRYIKNSYIFNIIFKYYHKMIQNNNKLSYFFFLNLNPKYIDINIHPKKRRINFYKKSKLNIDYLLKKVCKKAFKKYKKKNNIIYYYNNPINIYEKDIKINFPIINNNLFQKKNKKSFYIKSNKIVFQFYKKYILSFFKKKIIILNQHRVHKKILYEQFKNFNKKKLIEKLIIPINIYINKKKIKKFKKIKDLLINVGFNFLFYKKKILIKSIPKNIVKKNIFNMIENVILKFSKKKIIKKNFLKFLSKFLSIKSGDKLKYKKLICLIKNFFSIKKNYQLFDKKIFIVLTKKNIKKYFK